MNPDETALVLSGGGAYGAFGVGVMKVLYAGASPATHYQALTANVFTGTSVGAFNAAVMVDQPQESGPNRVRTLEEVWVNLIAAQPGKCGNGIFRVRGDPMAYLNPSCLSPAATVVSRSASDTFAISSYVVDRTINFIASSAEWSNRLLGLVNTSSFVDNSPFRDLLHQVIVEELIRKSPKRLQVIATNWVTGKVVRFTNADFHSDRGSSIIMASTAIPGFFPPVVMDGGLFVDGGAVENTPLSSAIDAGATELHVIYLDPQPKFIPIKAEPNTADTLLRLYYLMLASKLNEDIETARWINAGLRALARFRQSGTLSSESVRDLARVAGQISVEAAYKPLTIHRYFPRVVLGTQLDLVNFDLDRILAMIEEGERVALVHDCIASGCVLPDK
jgi:NTE family protein